MAGCIWKREKKIWLLGMPSCERQWIARSNIGRELWEEGSNTFFAPKLSLFLTSFSNLGCSCHNNAYFLAMQIFSPKEFFFFLIFCFFGNVIKWWWMMLFLDEIHVLSVWQGKEEERNLGKIIKKNVAEGCKQCLFMVVG